MILTVGIKGIKSSSHKTLNTIKHDCAKLVLDTDRAAAPAVLTDEIRSGKYSKVVIFCEKYGLSDKITAEIAAMSDEGLITTDFCCSDAVLFFDQWALAHISRQMRENRGEICCIPQHSNVCVTSVRMCRSYCCISRG